MSLIYVLGPIIIVLLLAIWYIRSVQKRYDEGEDNHPTLPMELVSESYSEYDDLPDDNTPVGLTVRDLGTASSVK